tara:strand:+ start:203 stop:556 length:354 start_codon:yes stop_codon:yes gene_type:complete
MPLTKKQMKIARVAEPRDKITGEDFKELRKASGGIVKFNDGGEVTSTEPRIIELEELAEFGDEDAAEIAKADLFKERDTKRLDKSVKTFGSGMSVKADGMARGCGAVVRGKNFRGTY